MKKKNKELYERCLNHAVALTMKNVPLSNTYHKNGELAAHVIAVAKALYKSAK